jgi:sterol desaturase/sphingolipid hydroxylase (fatty acid hydroxylase superfamily)
MLDALQRIATALLHRFQGFPQLVALTLGLFVVIYLLERSYGASPRSYWSREFFHDLGYLIYYRSGVHNLLLASAVFYLLAPLFQPLRLSLLDGWPTVARYFVYWIIFDFMAYWVHRWKHSSRILWAFHAVHHSQEKLSFVTLTRGHPFEQLFGSVIAFLPLVVLGAPPSAWLPLQLVREFLEAIQHSSIPWRLGPFYRLIVSPSFHSFHHSTDARHHHRNFGVNLALWDFLFGTAVDEKQRPTQFGLVGVKMPTVWSQLVRPFALLGVNPTASEKKDEPVMEIAAKGGQS